MLRAQLQDMGAYVAPPKRDKNTPTVEEYVRKKISDRSGLGQGVGAGKRGLKGTIGKFRDGTLQLSQREIAEVAAESRGGARGGRGRRGRGGRGGGFARRARAERGDSTR
jgi:hypothetical protein